MRSQAASSTTSGATDGRAPREGAQTYARAADVLRALSHPARLRVISLLAGGELCVKKLEEVLGIPQPAVSQHLSRLRRAGLIESERRGHLVCYRLSSGTAAAVLSAVLGRAERAKGA